MPMPLPGSSSAARGPSPLSGHGAQRPPAAAAHGPPPPLSLRPGGLGGAPTASPSPSANANANANNHRNIAPTHAPSASPIRSFQPSPAPTAASASAQPRRENGIRPFQLRQSPTDPIQSSAATAPNSANAMGRPNIPVLQVTVPQPAASYGPGQGYQQQPQQQRPSQQQQQYPSSPSSPFSSSSDTLIGSPYNNEKGGAKGMDYNGWSPSSSAGSQHKHQFQQAHAHPPPSPSIRNLQLGAPDDRTAHADNDRLAIATPRLAGQNDWWKRFSTVVKENERAEALGEKVGGRTPGSNVAKARSSWLDKENGKQRNFRLWVGAIGFLILAAIGGGVAYHFVTKDPDDKGDAQPKKQDFGLGTLSDEPTSTFDTLAAAADATPSELPEASIVQAGATLDRRSDLFLPVITPTATAHGVEKRRLEPHWHAIRDGLADSSLHHLD